jgi:hypothetical protein
MSISGAPTLNEIVSPAAPMPQMQSPPRLPLVRKLEGLVSSVILVRPTLLE